MATKIQLRRGTAAAWAAANPILSQGEPGFETDTGFLKYGNGVLGWSALAYGTDKWRTATNIRDFGAVGDAVTDDTAAIQAALNVGGRVYIPPTPAGVYYKVTAPLLITKPIMLFGSGSRSQIVCSNAFTYADDLIRVIPVDPVTTMYSFEDFTLGAVSQCRHGIHFDLTTSVVAGLAFLQMNRVQINVNFIAGQPGRSVKLTNPVNNDGFYASYFRGNYFLGGVHMERAGDSISFTENAFGYINAGLELSFTSGAAQVIIEKNNMTSQGGAIILHNGLQTKIRNNQIEQSSAYTGAEQACITLKGDLGTIFDCTIEGNNINGQLNILFGVDVQNAENTMIVDNSFAGFNHVNVGAAAKRTIIHGTQNKFANTAYVRVPMVTTVNAAAVGTCGPTFTPTLLNTWVQADAVNFPVQYSKNADGVVSITGQVSGGVRTPGTVILTLPAGFLPDANMQVACAALVGPSWATDIVQVDGAGNISYFGPNGASTISLNIRYKSTL